ncbi:glycoside hydrolase family 36 protein [Halobellus sp. Atlit-38R]|uniref:glycoside hydrolase family 36 protein n=1 Tax=Halobellus sp. Atlit-38R TaxID=2282131 RepID=UPI001F225C4F|nr:glycoside hydrolase family 36 protein [Halobellus sp. Atlit-38R]
MTRVDLGHTAVAYDPDTGRLTIEAGADALDSDVTPKTLFSGSLGLRLADNEDAHSDGDRDGLVVDVSVEAADRDRGDHGGDAIDLTVAVENRTREPVRLDAIEVLDGTVPFGPADRVFVHGYQSWSPTATLRLDERFPEETPKSRPQMVDLAAPDDALTSHAVTALTGDPGTLTLGFLDHDASLTRFDLRADRDADQTALTALCPLDGVAIGPGERRESATLRIDAGQSLSAGLESLAADVGERMDARVPETAPTGWCSWYHYFTDVTADDVRTNVADLDEWDVDLDVVQLDDGYETAFGDWRTLADGFESMRDLRDDVAAAGYEPGLWLAPFYVQADSRLAREHPEWLLTDAGDPVDAGARHGPMYALDTTHPEVTAWLRETFATVVEEWGFEYLKLDFLYAAALPGDRHGDVTRAEAYRHGLETIREAVGDAFILGCGAPGFPSVGLVDAMRIGPDTAPYWRREGDSASQPAHENAVRNVLNRQFCHRRLWVNDPDCQLVRETTELTVPEQESFAALVALTGGSNFLSDAVAEIDDAGRRLFERTLPPVEDGRVHGVGDGEFPDRVVCERPADGAVAVAAFNWSDEPRRVRVDPSAYVDSGDSQDSDRPAFTWTALGPTDSPNGLARGPVEREVAPHGCLLVHCTAAPPDPRPTVVGADHLANAGSQVADVTWADGTLSVRLDADRPMELVVAVPESWRLCESDRNDSDSEHTSTGAADGVDAITLTAAPGTNEFEFETRE